MSTTSRRAMQRQPVPGHPGVTKRIWVDVRGKAQHRYDASYRGRDRKEHSASFRTLELADRLLRDQRAAVDRGTWVSPSLGRTLLEDWSRTWLATRTRGIKPKTAESYASLLRSRILPTFGSWPLAALRPSDIQAWIGNMDDSGVSASRVRQAHVVLSLVLQAAVREGIIGRNVADGAELPRLPSAEAAYLEPGDVEAIAGQMPAPFDLFVRLLGTIGLRFGEGAALRRRSVDSLRARLVIEESAAEVRGEVIYGPTKSHAIRRVPLTSGLKQAIDELIERVGPDPDGLLFRSPGGGPLRHSNFYHRLWQPALRRAGLPRVGVHVLRHSAAAALIASGASPKAVQSILGHRSAAFTLTVYGHLFDADLDDVATRLEATIVNGVRDPRGISRIDQASASARKGR